MISAHGFTQNQLVLWKYPTMTKVLELPHAHSSRVLHMSMSPDGQMVCTGAADENLKFWKLFGVDVSKKKIAGGTGKAEGKYKSPDFGCSNLR
jgi:cell division cycle protein 20 (cofactor of APC complex)